MGPGGQHEYVKFYEEQEYPCPRVKLFSDVQKKHKSPKFESLLLEVGSEMVLRSDGGNEGSFWMQFEIYANQFSGKAMLDTFMQKLKELPEEDFLESEQGNKEQRVVRAVSI